MAVNKGGTASKPKKKVFTATVTTEKQQDIKTMKNTASMTKKAYPAKPSTGKSMIAPAKPNKPATTMFKGRKVTQLPKKAK